METLDIPEHISNRKDSTTITIRICRREILQLLQDVITNNNLFHLKRKMEQTNDKGALCQRKLIICRGLQ